LKDVLHQSISLLSGFVKICPAPLAAQFTTIQEDFGRLERRLTDYLTNDGSDWLNSLLSGGLSFSQFRQISIQDVHIRTDLMKVYNMEFSNLIKYRSATDGILLGTKAEDEDEEVFNPAFLSKVKVQLDNLDGISSRLKTLLKLES
jgi:hypothetical protein